MLVTHESSTDDPRSLRAAAARALTRLYGRMRTSAAFDVVDAAPTGTLPELARRRHCLLVTYRRDGRPVPTAMWFGVADGTVYCRSARDNAKVRRIANEPRVLVAPCTSRGRPLGPPMAGVARIAEGAEAARAEAVIRDRYSVGRRMYKAAVADALPAAYIAIDVQPAQR